MFKRFWIWVIESILRPRWVVSEDPEYGIGDLGLRILGVNLYYYKWSDPLIKFHDKGKFRIADKREFGEVIRN